MAAGRRKRGRESAADMVRSLGLVLLIVIVVWFLARPPHSAEKKIRVVDPTSDLQAFSAAVPGGAVPRTMPAGWQTTVSRYDPESGLLRIGWVTPAGHYAEYAAAAHPAEGFLADITGRAPQVDPVDIDGTSWTQYRKDNDISLVRRYGTTTVVLGTVRDTATLDELRVLARRLAA
jgi:hypothetical protein